MFPKLKYRPQPQSQFKAGDAIVKRGIPEKPSTLKEEDKGATQDKPFIRVGTSVRYLGTGTGKYRQEDWPEGAWMERGIEGTVVEYHPRLPAFTVRGKLFEAIEAWAVVRWSHGGRTAIDAESERKTWERKGTEPSTLKERAILAVENECEIVRPENYDLLKWVSTPAPDYSFQLEPEAKERKIDEILSKLREGVDRLQTSEQFREFLLTMAKFHEYSMGNQILIMLQGRDATHVAGFHKWKELGRYVKSGEKGIAILAPCLPPKGVRVAEEGDSQPYRCLKCGKTLSGRERKEVWADGLSLRCPYCGGETKVTELELRPVYFKVVYVFDISQTEGKPLPEFEVPILTTKVNEGLFAKALDLGKAQGLEVSFESRPELDPSIKGTYLGKTIWVRPEEPRGQQLKSLLHELAHYYTESVFRIPRADAEVMAESAAFVIGAHFGFDTGTRSFPYIVLWSKDKKVLEANLNAIRKICERMIEELGRQLLLQTGPEVDWPTVWRFYKEFDKALLQGKYDREALIAIRDAGKFPQRTAALARLGDYEITKIHDDGDLTVKSGGKLYVVTTEGAAYINLWSAMERSQLREGVI